MKKKLLIAIIGLMMMFSFVGCNNGVQSAESHIATLSGDDMYEFVDPETGVHYWVYSCYLGTGGMGGITPRLNADGTVMVTPVTE